MALFSTFLFQNLRFFLRNTKTCLFWKHHMCVNFKKSRYFEALSMRAHAFSTWSVFIQFNPPPMIFEECFECLFFWRMSIWDEKLSYLFYKKNVCSNRYECNNSSRGQFLCHHYSPKQLSTCLFKKLHPCNSSSTTLEPDKNIFNKARCVVNLKHTQSNNIGLLDLGVGVEPI